MWGKREYQETVVSVVVNTKHLRARESLLELIQVLGTTYADKTNVKFAQAYKELLTRHRISFPPALKQPFVEPTNKPAASRSGGGARGEGLELHRSSRQSPDEIDVLDPVGLYGLSTTGKYEEVRTSGGGRNGGSGRANNAPDSKRSAKEASIEEQLDSVSSSLSLLNDIIDNLGEKEKINDNELIPSILPEIERTHENIMRILQGSEVSKLGETLTARLFSANDAIAEALQKLEKAKKGILPTRRPPSAPVAPPKPSVPQEDDEFDEFDAIAQRKRGPSGGDAILSIYAQKSASNASPSFPPADLLSLPTSSSTSSQTTADILASFSSAPQTNANPFSFPPTTDFGNLTLQQPSLAPPPEQPRERRELLPGMQGVVAPRGAFSPDMPPTGIGEIPFFQGFPMNNQPQPFGPQRDVFGNNSLI